VWTLLCTANFQPPLLCLRGTLEGVIYPFTFCTSHLIKSRTFWWLLN